MQKRDLYPIAVYADANKWHDISESMFVRVLIFHLEFIIDILNRGGIENFFRFC